VLEGVLNVTNNWYGFIANMSLAMGGGFRFRFSYPYEMQVQNVILYNEEDVEKLDQKQSCWQKDGIIRTRNVPDQILDLSFRSSWNGCISKNGTGGRTLTCVGERRYEMPRKVFMAVSNCRGINGLYLNYRLEVSGFEGDLCNSGSAPSLHSRTRSCAGALGLLLALVVSCWLCSDDAPVICSDSCHVTRRRSRDYVATAGVVAAAATCQKYRRCDVIIARPPCSSGASGSEGDHR